MKTITYPNDPMQPILHQSASLQNELSLGLTKREHMAIEFTKALLSSLNPSNDNWCPNRSSFDYCVKMGISIADETIKQLNHE